MTDLHAEWMSVPFRKSSFSDTTGGQCVEVGTLRGRVGIRDSKNPAAGILAIPAAAWAIFTGRMA